MKKISVLLILVSMVLFFSTQIYGQTCLKLLTIEQPAKSKDKLNLDLDQLNAILKSFGLEGASAEIQFTDKDGNALAVLGKVLEGVIQWDHKVVEGKFLQVKFSKTDFAAILEKVAAKTMDPGYIIQLTTGESCKITFKELPDLAVQMRYPINIAPGDSLAKDLAIVLENKGTAEARDFNVEVVISSDSQVPDQPASESVNFQEDCLLEGGRETVPSIKPGEKLTLTPKGSLKIPADTYPGRYYLGVLVDPGNRIEELSEDNNKEVGFFMISVPEPKRVLVELPGTQLVYQPTGFLLNIRFRDISLSDGQDWRKCSIKPYIHQIKHATWEEDVLWEVETVDRSVWRVKGIKFCQKGGKSTELKMKADVKGGSSTVMPTQFTINFTDTWIEFEPGAGKFRVLTSGDSIAHTALWTIMKIRPHLCHIKHRTWTDFFWELDAFKKEVRQVTGGKFGQAEVGGTATVLDLNVIVEPATEAAEEPRQVTNENEQT